jgi:bifunctional DNase/RNase
MYKEVSLKALYEQKSSYGVDFVLYLQIKREKTIIPAPLNYQQGQSLIKVLQNEITVPHIYDTLRRVVSGLGAKPKCVMIHTFNKRDFGAQIQIDSRDGTLEFGAKFVDAIGFGLMCNIPILVEEKVAKVAGVSLDHELKNFTTFEDDTVEI